VGPYKSPSPTLLDLEHPATFGPIDLQDYYMEHKKAQHEAIKGAKKVVIEVGKEYEKLSGRKYGLFETYKLKDADVAVVLLSSAAGTGKAVVDDMRKSGIKAGLLKPRLFRPFPYIEYANALKGCKAICVMDRCDSFGSAGGPLFTEFRSAMYDVPNRPLMINKIYGLGGRDLGLGDIRKVFMELVKLTESGKVNRLYEYITVRS
jgi:pyruvate ferredoxin oxidoreductase alpha subunit